MIGTATGAPYTLTWAPTTTGSQTLTARAFDNEGEITVSADIGVTVVANVAPTLSLTSPYAGSTYTAPASVTIEAKAEDTDGLVSQVEFFRDGVSIGVDLLPPYAAADSGLAVGGYTFAAVATDNLGGKATNQIALTVIAPAGPITLTDPAVVNGDFHVTVNGTALGVTYELQVSATLGDGFPAPAAATFNGTAAPIPLAVTGGGNGAAKYYRVRVR